MWLLVKIGFGFLALVLSVIVWRFLSATIRYQLIKRRLPKDIPRQKETFAVFQPFSGGYEDMLRAHQDEDGRLLKVLFRGPHTDGAPILSFCSPEALKTVLTDTTTFIKNPNTHDLFADFLGDGLVSLKDNEWKRHRRLLTPLFHFGPLKNQVKVAAEVANSIIEDLRSRNGEPLDGEFIKRWTMRVIVTTAFGSSFDSDWMVTHWIQLIRSIADYFTFGFLFGNIFRYLPLPLVLNQRKQRKVIVDKVKETITARKKELETEGFEEGEANDLITLLLTAKEPVSYDAIVDEGITFLFAGYDTVSSLLQWCFYFLAKYPDVQAKVYQNVVDVLGDGEMDNEAFNKLDYCKCFVREVLRLRPPVPFLDKVVTKDCEVDGVKVPKGACILPFWHPAHLDPDIWKNPNDFIPERFAEGSESKDRHPFSYVPFSAGERNCIGQKMAFQETVIFMAMIVKNFTVQSDSLDKVKMDMISINTPVPLSVSFKERKQTEVE